MLTSISAADMVRYADHTVTFRQAQINNVHVSVVNGVVTRWTHQIHRIPEDRLFVVWIYQGATDREIEAIRQTCALLPVGEWARFPDQWRRSEYRRTGRCFYRQNRGVIADDPFAQLELEFMIDAGSEVRL